MLVPLLWLKDYVNIDGVSIKNLADKLTMSGSSVESIDDTGEEIQNIVTGRILNIRAHPDADRLLVAQVDVGGRQLQIVAGAKNIKEGDMVPVALPGAVLPGGMKIKKSRLRGVESQGMMCSAQELNLNPEDYPGAVEYGIMTIQRECSPGQDIKEVLGIGGGIMEFEITSNRPDCLSMIGMARETAATLDRALNYPDIAVVENKEKAEDYVQVDVADWDLCPRYAARVVKNVKIADSPAWIRDRLILAGVRPINNIVDITNFIMLELGQPMHAFDLGMLQGNRVTARRAREKEVIETLDGQKRKLDTDMLVIADAERPVAVAGVMGGANSEIFSHTSTILLESANFNSTSVRLTSKKLGIRTESSSRFEKGVDINIAAKALDRAVQLIDSLNAGEAAGGIIDRYRDVVEDRILKVGRDKINGLLGIHISSEEMVDILKKVEIKICSIEKDSFTVSIPTFRQDIEGEADIAEEVARLYGYDNIRPTLLRGEITKGGKNKRQKIMDLSKDILNASGLFEIVTYSFVSPGVFDKIHLPKDSEKRKYVEVSNPLGEDTSVMRTTLIPSILQVLATNYSRRLDDAGVFEINRVFIPETLPLDTLPVENNMICIGAYGGHDFYSLKGIVEGLFEGLGIMNMDMIPNNHPAFHPGRTAQILVHGEPLGVIGEIHPDAADNFDIGERVYVAEIEFEKLIKHVSLDNKYVPLPKYPAITRDIAVLVKERVLVKDIYGLIISQGGDLVEEVKLFDIYKGKQVPDGYKSVAYSIRYRDKEKTLKDEEVNSVHEKIINALTSEFGAKLR